MDIKVVFSIYKELIDDNLSLIYQGDFSDDVTAKILHLSENNIDNYESLSKLKRKVSFIMVECFQNIVRHKEKIETKKNDSVAGLFLTRNIGDDYFITSANIIEKHAVEDLKEKLKNINALSKDDLKELYLERLENNEFTEKGGAGLGLIEMARKSGNKLEFDFEPLDDEYTYFYLRIKISRATTSSLGQPVNAGEKVILHLARGFRHEMMGNNILMIYKGDFSQNAILPVLKMIEENLAANGGEEGLQKKIFWVLVEMLQNISKHGIELEVTDGIFMLGRDQDNRYYVSTGNLMHKNDVLKFQKHLDKINQLDKHALSALYKQTLRDGQISEDGGAGIGIIDIARESGSKLDYDFIDFDQDAVFFSLNTTI